VRRAWIRVDGVLLWNRRRGRYERALYLCGWIYDDVELRAGDAFFGRIAARFAALKFRHVVVLLSGIDCLE